MRTDSGIISAMYIAPTSGSILNSAELVNAIVLEHVKADTFIAGGLKLSDGAGMHAYVVRAPILCSTPCYMECVIAYAIQCTTTDAHCKKQLQPRVW